MKIFLSHFPWWEGWLTENFIISQWKERNCYVAHFIVGKVNKWKGEGVCSTLSSYQPLRDPIWCPPLGSCRLSSLSDPCFSWSLEVVKALSAGSLNQKLSLITHDQRSKPQPLILKLKVFCHLAKTFPFSCLFSSDLWQSQNAVPTVLYCLFSFFVPLLDGPSKLYYFLLLSHYS